MKAVRNIYDRFFISIVIFSATKSTFSYLNENEIAIVSDLIDEFNIRFCITLISNTDIYDIKIFPALKIPAVQLKADQFTDYIRSIPALFHGTNNYIEGVDDDYRDVYKSEDFSTVVIFKGKSLTTLEELTQTLDNVA